MKILQKIAKKAKVVSIMSREIFTFSPDATLTDAAELMLEKKVSSCIILDKKPVGIVTRTDLLKEAFSSKFNKKKKLKEVMSTRIYAVPPSISLTQALFIMNSQKVSKLLIEEKGKTKGVVTKKDVMKAINDLSVSYQVLLTSPMFLLFITIIIIILLIVGQL